MQGITTQAQRNQHVGEKIVEKLCKRNLQELCQLLVKPCYVAPEQNNTKLHKYIMVNIKCSEDFTGRWGWRGVS